MPMPVTTLAGLAKLQILQSHPLDAACRPIADRVAPSDWGRHAEEDLHKDAKDCPQCQQIWQMMRQRDEEQLGRILEHMKQHLDKEMKGAAAA